VNTAVGIGPQTRKLMVASTTSTHYASASRKAVVI
jgi:hypothetical protein